MAQRVLITGGSGFVGQWLARTLVQRGATVFGGTVEGAPEPVALSAQELGAVRWLELDITSEQDIARALEKSAPDQIFHLAGIASPPEANASPVRTFDVNALG